MNNKLAKFIQANRLVANVKVAALKVAIDFSTKDEYRTYMHEHPGADPAHHRVVPTEHKHTEQAPAPTTGVVHETPVKTPRDVRRNFGTDAIVKMFHMPSGAVAFSYKPSEKDDEYRLVIGGKEVAKGISVEAYDEHRWKASDKSGSEHLFHDGKEVASGQNVDSWSNNMWSATDMEGKSRLFWNGKQVDEVNADSGKLDGVSDGIWIKSDLSNDTSALYINGVKVADGKDIRKMVSEKGVESDGLVQVDGHSVNAKNYQSFVRNPEFWNQYVIENGNPFTGDHQPVNGGAKHQNVGKDEDKLNLPEKEGDKVVSDKGSEELANGKNVKRNYKWTDTALAEGVLQDAGVSDSSLKELAGYKVGLSDADRQNRKPRSLAEVRQDFLSKMGPKNYETEEELQTAKKRIADMPLEEFSMILILIVANEEDKGDKEDGKAEPKVEAK